MPTLLGMPALLRCQRYLDAGGAFAANATWVPSLPLCTCRLLYLRYLTARATLVPTLLDANTISCQRYFMSALLHVNTTLFQHYIMSTLLCVNTTLCQHYFMSTLLYANATLCQHQLMPTLLYANTTGAHALFPVHSCRHACAQGAQARCSVMPTLLYADTIVCAGGAGSL